MICIHTRSADKMTVFLFDLRVHLNCDVPGESWTQNVSYSFDRKRSTSALVCGFHSLRTERQGGGGQECGWGAIHKTNRQTEMVCISQTRKTVT